MSVETSALFAVTGLAFWGLLLFETIILLACIEYEAGVWSALSLVAVGLVLKSCDSFDVFSWTYNNPWLFVQYVLCYFVVGTGYSILKWWSWARNEREKYDERKNSFLKGRSIKDGKVP